MCLLQDREAILRLHTSRLPLAEDVDISHIARSSHGYSGADIAALCREAASSVLIAGGDHAAGCQVQAGARLYECAAYLRILDTNESVHAATSARSSCSCLVTYASCWTESSPSSVVPVLQGASSLSARALQCLPSTGIRHAKHSSAADCHQAGAITRQVINRLRASKTLAGLTESKQPTLYERSSNIRRPWREDLSLRQCQVSLQVPEGCLLAAVERASSLVGLCMHGMHAAAAEDPLLH